MINFDLHIHSFASRYKETDGVVDNSKKENICVLLEKLNSYNIALFSITDHNRFDIELYEELDKTLRDNADIYPNVKCLLAGVEFDVNLESGMESCHIIAIFDAKNNRDNYAKICGGIAAVKEIKNKDEYYTREEFEKILKKIELPVILIAHQKKSMGSSTGKHRSLSDSTSHPNDLIKLGFISALEIQKNKVEGILKNELQKIGIDIALVYGSDCHDWSVYPCHDLSQPRSGFETPPHAEILPTFRGLLMAVTSPQTRFKRRINDNANYIKSFSINNKKIELHSGINVITGENGAGKSTLLALLCARDGVRLPQYITKLRDKNSIQIENSISRSRVQYVAQNEIIERYNCSIKELFSKSHEILFNEVDHSQFEEAYKKFGHELLEFILNNINVKLRENQLKMSMWKLPIDAKVETYFVRTCIPQSFATIQNEYKEAHVKFLNVMRLLKEISENKSLTPFMADISGLIDEVGRVHKLIAAKFDEKEVEIEVKNAIVSACRNYDTRIRELSTLRDREYMENEDKRTGFIDCVVSHVLNSLKRIEFPVRPSKVNGGSKNLVHGFYFNQEAKYHQTDVYDDFLKAMFNKAYQSEVAIGGINDIGDFSSAVRNCGAKASKAEVSSIYQSNLSRFIDEQKELRAYIANIDNANIGNTLGEMALAYYEYVTDATNEWDVLVIDQPEDNISNKNVQERLVAYLGKLRDTKQIIYVTHNPLLVVNIDADNIIYLTNSGGKIDAVAGSLEYEDEDVNILNLIAENMDGGKEAVQRRVRVYE